MLAATPPSIPYLSLAAGDRTETVTHRRTRLVLTYMAALTHPLLSLLGSVIFFIKTVPKLKAVPLLSVRARP